MSLAHGVSRRRFLDLGLIAAIGFGLSSCTSSGTLKPLRPPPRNVGFGGIVNTGRKLTDILASFARTNTPAYFAEARAYVVPFPEDAVPEAKALPYPAPIIGNLEHGFVVLYQKCSHLGCRVPFCVSSQWFECPCHGGKFNRVGEKRDGPPPRGMSRFLGAVAADGTLSIDTRTEYLGEPLGTDTTGQEPEGPSCV